MLPDELQLILEHFNTLDYFKKLKTQRLTNHLKIRELTREIRKQQNIIDTFDPHHFSPYLTIKQILVVDYYKSIKQYTKEPNYIHPRTFQGQPQGYFHWEVNTSIFMRNPAHFKFSINLDLSISTITFHHKEIITDITEALHHSDTEDLLSMNNYLKYFITNLNPLFYK